jgi:hypothetical protein
MSDREEDLAYGHDHSKDRGSEGTDRGFVSDTFKFLKSKHQQSQHQSHTQPSYGYTEQPYSSGSQQYTPGQSGYVSQALSFGHQGSEIDKSEAESRRRRSTTLPWWTALSATSARISQYHLNL